jgi:ubiquinone/menaquinone biosynthesis C-methylase UbiE
VSEGVSSESSLRERFARTADLIARREEDQRAALSERVRRFVTVLQGDERALDAGTGTGALAFALAPLVAEVTAVDPVPELLEEGRKRAADFPNVTFVEGDATSLPFALGAFDLTATLRTLHHVPRPELVLAELTRVTRAGGYLLVVDQIAPADPMEAFELNQFERARDPSHTRALSDQDLRGLFEANGLIVVRANVEEEKRDLESYLELAGCEGEGKERALGLAPAGYHATLGWYLLHRRGFSS